MEKVVRDTSFGVKGYPITFLILLECFNRRLEVFIEVAYLPNIQWKNELSFIEHLGSNSHQQSAVYVDNLVIPIDRNGFLGSFEMLHVISQPNILTFLLKIHGFFFVGICINDNTLGIEIVAEVLEVIPIVQIC